jgi:hypothetical protein
VHFKEASSPLVHALQLPLLWACLALGVGTSAALATAFGVSLAPSAGCGYAVTAAALFASRHALIAGAVSAAYEASLGVARTALLRHKPDVVVGFSWGGALALDLVHNGGPWQGPTVLLAPAHEKLLALRGLLLPQQPPPPLGSVVGRATPPPQFARQFALPLRGPTVVVHSLADTLVPIASSRRLCSAAVDSSSSNNSGNRSGSHAGAARLVEIAHDPHAMWSIAAPATGAAESILAAAVLEVAAALASGTADGNSRRSE